MTELDIEFSGLSPLCEVRLFTTGAAPVDVQVWQPPCEQADVLLFPSHADDDVIFFGALAAQCVDRGLAVQVAYLVNHYDWQPRPPGASGRALDDGHPELSGHRAVPGLLRSFARGGAAEFR